MDDFLTLFEDVGVWWDPASEEQAQQEEMQGADYGAGDVIPAIAIARATEGDAISVDTAEDAQALMSATNLSGEMLDFYSRLR